MLLASVSSLTYRLQVPNANSITDLKIMTRRNGQFLNCHLCVCVSNFFCTFSWLAGWLTGGAGGGIGRTRSNRGRLGAPPLQHGLGPPLPVG